MVPWIFDCFCKRDSIGSLMDTRGGAVDGLGMVVKLKVYGILRWRLVVFACHMLRGKLEHGVVCICTVYFVYLGSTVVYVAKIVEPKYLKGNATRFDQTSV